MENVKYFALIIFTTTIFLMGCGDNPEQEKLAHKFELLLTQMTSIDSHVKLTEQAETKHKNNEITKKEALLILRVQGGEIKKMTRSLWDVEGRKFIPFESVVIQKEFESALEHLVDGYYYSGQAKVFGFPLNDRDIARKYSKRSIDELKEASDGFLRVKEKLGMPLNLKEFNGFLPSN